MTRDLHLGIYAHHVGAGHLARAEAIGRAWEGRVTVLTSRPPATLAGSGFDVVVLPEDEPDTGARTPGNLHHAPLGDTGLRDRMARIATWIRAARPDVVLVDVSVEVALLCRLHGVPTAVVRHPGDRDDPAHRLCWDTADLVLAPWGEPGERDDVLHVGLVSRFDDQQRRLGPFGDDRVEVVVAVGAGGTSLRHRDLAALATALPDGYRLDVVGEVPGEPVEDGPVAGWVHDPWSVFVGADVVVASASLNLVAEVAAAGVPLVVVPEDRPHGEQVAHAQVLAELWDVPVAADWTDDLAGRIERALAAGPSMLTDRRGAARAAEALAKLTAGAM